MNKRVLFYSNVKNIYDFKTSTFYTTDIKILSDLGFNVTMTNKIGSFFRFREYEIAFIYFFRKGYLPGLIAKLFRKKIFFTGGIDYLSPTFASSMQLLVQRILFIVCYLESTKCIIVSLSDMANIRLFWRWQKKLINIPHVISVNDFNPSLTKQDIITSICWMGSIANVKRKGVDQLIRSFSIFSQYYPSFKVRIIGRLGEGHDYLRQISEELKIANKVMFCGPITDSEKAEILAESKYYCQLSKFEGFGLATLEAMASGCIIIHSGQGGLKEIVQTYGTVVSELNNPEAIANILINCESGREEYQQLAIEGYKSVCSRFNYPIRYNEFKRILI